ncbi:MAG: GNAT family N-acetyltransferase [Alloprevotella sp.]
MEDITLRGKEQRLTGEQLAELFLSVEWSSGHYPDKLERAMQNYATVFTAWHGDKLVGLISAMDDGVMTAYIHYLLVRPDYQGRGIGKMLLDKTKQKYAGYLRIALMAYKKECDFYERQGFTKREDEVPMFITSLWT